MKICEERQEQEPWKAEDFKPGDVIKADNFYWVVLKKSGSGIEWDVHGVFVGHFPATRVYNADICWISPEDVTHRYPNACIRLGEPEMRP